MKNGRILSRCGRQTFSSLSHRATCPTVRLVPMPRSLSRSRWPIEAVVLVKSASLFPGASAGNGGQGNTVCCPSAGLFINEEESEMPSSLPKRLPLPRTIRFGWTKAARPSFARRSRDRPTSPGHSSRETCCGVECIKGTLAPWLLHSRSVDPSIIILSHGAA